MNPQRINTAMEQAHTALRNLRTTFTAQEAHEVIAEVNDVPVETGAELFAIMQVMGFIKDAKESRMVSFDVTDLTKEVAVPLFRAAKPTDKKTTPEDVLAIGNLKAQHRAAKINQKLREALEACKPFFDDDYMSGVIKDALETEPLAEDDSPKTPYGSIQKVISYNWEAEFKDYAIWKDENPDGDGHIYQAMMKVQAWLDNQPTEGG